MSHTAHVMRAREQARQRNTARSNGNGFYGKITDKWYPSIESMEHYEGQEARRRAEPTPLEKYIAETPLEKLRQDFDQIAASEREQQERITCNEVTIPTFLELHPEFEDAVEDNPNGFLLASYWQSRGVKYPTLNQFEEAYEFYKSKNAVKLKEDVVRKQQKDRAVANARQAQESRTMPSDDELESMSLEEIRRRATAGAWLR
jgi:hypothetical protein